MASPAIIHPEREQWLMRRRELLTASDVAAVLGVDPRRGPFAVYASKVSDSADADETAWMKWGRRVEGAIADWYADETGRQVMDLGAHAIQHHRDVPWLGATLDRQTLGSVKTPDPFGGVEFPPAGSRISPATVFSARGPLEAKAVAGFKAAEWREDPPLHYQVQLQVQLVCTQAQWGSLVALIGGISLAWKDQLRNDAFLVAAYPKLEEFWSRVQRREPPEADALPGTTEAIRRLWPEADGETVPLDGEALELVAAWEKAKADGVDAEKAEEGVANRLRVRMGSATFGALPDGSYLTLKVTDRSAYEVEATKYRALRRWWPRRARR